MVRPSGMTDLPSLPGITFDAPLYLSISRYPTSRKGGIFFQHVFVAHDPDKPWHLQSVFMYLFTACAGHHVHNQILYTFFQRILLAKEGINSCSTKRNKDTDDIIVPHRLYLKISPIHKFLGKVPGEIRVEALLSMRPPWCCNTSCDDAV